MKPVRIYIENYKELKNLKEIKYVFQTLLTSAGLPYHFVSDANKKDIDILYSKNPDTSNAKVWIYASSSSTTPVISGESDGVFLFKSDLSQTKPGITHVNGSIHIHSDIIYTANFFLTGSHEKSVPKNKYGHHEIADLSLYKEKYLHIPFISSYVNFIRETFKDHAPADLFANGKNVVASLTHDVDYPEIINSIESLRYIYLNKKDFSLKKAFKILGGSESFWRFHEYLEIERKHNFKSAFYFCAFKGSLFRYAFVAPDPFYNIGKKRFRELFKELYANGNEIGLHASYDAHTSEKKFRKEKNRLEEMTGKPVSGNRHHYWHWDQSHPYKTAHIHQQIELLYDTSLGYEKRSGFRYGISFPFHLYHPEHEAALSILQIPTCIMDDHYGGYKHLTYFKDYKEEIDEIIDNLLRFGGVFNITYHARVLNETFFPGFKESYMYIINKLAEKSITADNPENIAKHWIAREKAIAKLQIDELK
jgi:hypothetical protein